MPDRVIQTKAQLEQRYEEPDPWNVQTHPVDAYRKHRILKAMPGRYGRALDIGAGEGWISKDLPADVIEAIELSDAAAWRFPYNVARVLEPSGSYDLILAAGVFYEHYDFEVFHRWIHASATGRVVTCHISHHERMLEGPLVKTVKFDYRDGTQQVLRAYDFSAAQH